MLGTSFEGLSGESEDGVVRGTAAEAAVGEESDEVCG